MQYYSYSDYGSFKRDPHFSSCFHRVIVHASDPQNLLQHRLFQLGHIADVAKLHNIADTIHAKYKYLVVIGMGGAILNPKMITSLRDTNTPHIIYCDHIDSRTINHLAITIDLEHTAFLVISKSGDTIETLALLGTWYSYLQKFFITDLAHRFYIITASHDSELRRLGQHIGAKILEHDAEISGRYASFTNITVLPGLIAGVDMAAFCQAGQRALNLLFSAPENHAAVHGAATLLYMMEHGISQSVTMPYSPTLSSFVEWQAQILAESLGKQGHGLTPVKAVGPLDQHSQLQLYLDGPRNKFFTIIYRADHDTDTTPPIKIGTLAGHSLHEVCDAEYSAMLSTLKSHELPHRAITLSNQNEESLGTLVMHSMLEVALCGFALGINPFDQPAVESIKKIINKELRSKIG